MHGQIDRTLSIPIYKGKCPVSCGIRPPSFHLRRNSSRKMARLSGPQYSICQHRAMGMLQPQVCTQVPKLGSLNSSVATRLITGHMRNTPHAIGPAASSCSRGFPQEGSKVGQSAQKRRSADRFCCILPFVFKVSTKICLFLCIVCEWTNDAPACIIKPETREVQQKLK